MSLLEVSKILFAGGMLAVIVLFMYAAVKILWKTEPKASWIEAVLALVAVLSLFIVLIIDAFVFPVIPAPLLILALTCIIGGILGALLQIVEHRKSAYSAQHSSSLFFLAIIALLGAFVVFIPILPQQFWPEKGSHSTPTATAIAAEPSTTPLPSPTMTLSPTSTTTPTATPQTTHQPTATATRERYSTRTPTPTATVARFCGAVVEYNLNLRRERSTDAELITVIPFSSIVDVGGRSENGEWWFIEYNDEWGWVMGDYITTEALCDNAPTLE